MSNILLYSITNKAALLVITMVDDPESRFKITTGNGLNLKKQTTK